MQLAPISYLQLMLLFILTLTLILLKFKPFCPETCASILLLCSHDIVIYSITSSSSSVWLSKQLVSDFLWIHLCLSTEHWYNVRKILAPWSACLSFGMCTNSCDLVLQHCTVATDSSCATGNLFARHTGNQISALSLHPNMIRSIMLTCLRPNVNRPQISQEVTLTLQ